MNDLTVSQAGVVGANPGIVAGQVALIQQVMKEVMKPDVHYGVIPGVNKPSLFKPGAEKLAFTFRLAVDYDEPKIVPMEHGHMNVIIRCRLFHMESQTPVGSAFGSCSTMEKKYRYRDQSVVTDIKVPKAYWDNRDGKILEIEGSKHNLKGPFVAKKTDAGYFLAVKGEPIENPDIADVYNTVLKMAEKRAFVAAILGATAASDIFTQDVEDFEVGTFASVSGGLAKSQASGQNESGQAPNQASNDNVGPVQQPLQNLATEEDLNTLVRTAKQLGLSKMEFINKIVTTIGKPQDEVLTPAGTVKPGLTKEECKKVLEAFNEPQPDIF